MGGTMFSVVALAKKDEKFEQEVIYISPSILLILNLIYILLYLNSLDLIFQVMVPVRRFIQKIRS